MDEIISIHRYGAVGHGRGHADGRTRQETRIYPFEDGLGPAPVRVLVKNGIWLDTPEIIESPPCTHIGIVRVEKAKAKAAGRG